jgi:two-component system, OmpR family, response regulator
MRILLVEDQRELAGEIAKRIERAGFVVDHVDSIQCAREALRNALYGLTLMDRRLPDGDGLSLIAEIRKKQPGIRILMLTALDALDDRIDGLDAGADDYLTKPFSLEEMMARIRASLRRPGGDPVPPVSVGEISFDLGARTVVINGHPAVFHRRELLLLEALIRRVGRVVGRKTLMAEIYGYDEEIQPHALTILVSRLRSRLDELGAGVEIHSARGVGYLIAGSKR